MIILENDKYLVKLDLNGGQIARFHDKTTLYEYVYDALDEVWGYTTPTLFPIIGSSYDKKYHFSGQVTEMKNHGILRDAKFTLVSNKDNQAVLEFSSNSETLKVYPFYFTIYITYTLIENKLVVEYKIVNNGVIDMPFNFGLHPAFFVPINPKKQFEDYKIVFSSPTHLYGAGPKVNEGLVSEISLDKQLFKENPTWLYNNVNAHKIGLTDGENGVWVSTVGFPVVAVWAPVSDKAKFVCLEPWLGVSKKVEKDLAFSDRDATMILSENRQLLLTYTIEVY